uniref:FXYD domain-containing ion transport regulator n=1 Tax=Scleropages formosus TaxID=113540 RepID=A0A8C9VYV2_SCLFO
RSFFIGQYICAGNGSAGVDGFTVQRKRADWWVGRHHVRLALLNTHTRSGGQASRPQRNLPAVQPHRRINMSSGGAPEVDPDADFVYDYHTLRIGGLIFAGVIVFLSILLLAGNSIRRCGKSKPSPPKEDS